MLQGLAGGLALLCLFMTYIQYATAGREGFLAFYSPQAEVGGPAAAADRVLTASGDMPGAVSNCVQCGNPYNSSSSHSALLHWLTTQSRESRGSSTAGSLANGGELWCVCTIQLCSSWQAKPSLAD